MSPRDYSLQVEEVGYGDELTGIYSKGHHGAGSKLIGDPFLAAAKARLRDVHAWDEDELEELTGDTIEFVWWRCVPMRDCGEWVSRFVRTAPGKPGAFPATVLWLDCC